jgi:hypothetical protein
MKIKNIADLREVLASEIEAVQKGKRDSRDASAISSLASRIMTSVKLEMSYHKSLGHTPTIGFISSQQKRLG